MPRWMSGQVVLLELAIVDCVVKLIIPSNFTFIMARGLW
jgi:hypothetical protein